MAVFIKELANGRNIGQEKEMKEIDIECATANILQRSSDHRKFRKIVLVVTEVHKRDGQQSELGQCRGNISPFQPEIMPFKHIHGR